MLTDGIVIYKELGRTGEKISAIGIGTWKMGVNPDKEVKSLGYAIDNGVNLVDTAEMYGTEPIVGRAISGRKEVFIATKVSPHHFKHDDVVRACNDSLRRLGVERIDLYQLHWPNRSIPIKETMRAMEELKAAGKIRHIGVSNFSVDEFEEARAALKDAEIVSNQVEYSVLVREPESGLLDYCEKNGITLIAYSPLARGALHQKRYSELADLLSEIGSKYNRSIEQVALNWLLSKKPVVAIPKSSSLEHTKSNIASADFSLSAEDIGRINDFLPQ
ncbi:MAG: aldo/keto reductase [Candidatus Marsarchaeota archaeon]|nr:aldo/keto reductase [Candidatus Marsarchaeota archaeon]MCL5112477.1 aldo/keto reductase [Candidatus Marsarchaeota archaeon]